MLEETGLPYEPHFVDFGRNEQKSPEFVSLNPNGRIPAILELLAMTVMNFLRVVFSDGDSTPTRCRIISNPGGMLADRH